MQNVILTIQGIIDSTATRKEAEASLCKVYKKLSPRAAKIVLDDMEDFKSGKIDENKLSLFLYDQGLQA